MPQSDSLLVTGGAGYIGSHVVLALLESGYDVVVVDDLSTGRRDALPSGTNLLVGDVGDQAFIAPILEDLQPAAVLHFAGSIVAPESTVDPLKYYANNTCASLVLTRACVAAGVNRFLFSSTAAVYGNPESVPIPETAPTIPINPYGTSKLMTEWVLRDTQAAEDLEYVALRYFNVAGADPKGRAGQSTPIATHLIKIACQAVLGQRDGIEIYGEDYPTPDGTCIRDYIHVTDLAAAHRVAVDYLIAGGASDIFNCGYGTGYSVREVLDVVQTVAGKQIPISGAPPRPGDPAQLVADAGRIRDRLGWAPQHDDLRVIAETALKWEERLAAAAG